MFHWFYIAYQTLDTWVKTAEGLFAGVSLFALLITGFISLIMLKVEQKFNETNNRFKDELFQRLDERESRVDERNNERYQHIEKRLDLLEQIPVMVENRSPIIIDTTSEHGHRIT